MMPAGFHTFSSPSCRDEPRLRRYGEAARKIALEEFSLEIHARHYIALFERMMGQAHEVEASPASEPQIAAGPAL